MKSSRCCLRNKHEGRPDVLWFPPGGDLRTVAAAFALGRESDRLESDLGRVVEEYRAAFRHRPEASFEPLLALRPNGRLRLSWGFAQTLHAPGGVRRITQHIAGRPTDRWMRGLGLRATTRKEVGAFIKRLLPLERRYRRIGAWIGHHRRRVHELLSRVKWLTVPGAWPKAVPVGPAVGRCAPDRLRSAALPDMTVPRRSGLEAVP